MELGLPLSSSLFGLFILQRKVCLLVFVEGEIVNHGGSGGSGGAGVGGGSIEMFISKSESLGQRKNTEKFSISLLKRKNE
jgi:hypothetical protein